MWNWRRPRKGVEINSTSGPFTSWQSNCWFSLQRWCCMGAPEQQHVNLSYGISLINMQHEDRNTYRRAKDSTAQNRGTLLSSFFFCLHLRKSCLTWQNSLAPASAASLWSRRGLIQEINPAAAFLRIQQAAPPLSPILTFWELIFFQNVNSQNVNFEKFKL